MKFKIDVCGTAVIVDHRQLQKLTALLEEAERFEDKYVGSRPGHTGSQYIKLIRPYQPSENLRPYCLSDSEYEALKLVTKLEDENNGNR